MHTVPAPVQSKDDPCGLVAVHYAWFLISQVFGKADVCYDPGESNF